ncbi:MAG: UDP-N-acetylmuramate dehydrogenase [Desulfovibrionaceae bacterium]
MSTTTLPVLRPGPKLSGRTTLGIGGRCLAEAAPRTEAELDLLAAFLDAEKGRPFVLGGGSNLLASDADSDLVLLCVGHDGLELFEREGQPMVRAGAGLKLPVLLSELARAGLSGLEGLAGIPGTVGGALAMNAGSWGQTFGERVVRAALWAPYSGLGWIGREALHFGYRAFYPGLPGKWLAWEVELSLTRAEPEAVQGAMRGFMEQKRAGQPLRARTAGCVFKNPEGESAGRLLDQAGMKGARIGPMVFSERHANFLVNEGGGTFAQAMELLERGREKVRERFGVDLETEVVILS